MTEVCIIGGGNLGHVMGGFIAARPGFRVTMLTRHPEKWSRKLVIEQPDGSCFVASLAGVTSNVGEAVRTADVVLLCLPGYAIREALLSIVECLKHGVAVGSVVSSTGFFMQAFNVLPHDVALFGFQRVPFIARTQEYGHRARLMGYKESLSVAVEQTVHKEELRQMLEAMTATPTQLLESYYEASLTNSNPLLHPARLYSLWKEWHEGDVCNSIPLFYEEWDDVASQLYIEMDSELQRILAVLPVRKGCIPTVLDYYESIDAASLTRKLRSIEAFKGIKAPMKPAGGGFVPDLQSRYFTEDFPFGLDIVRRIGSDHGIPTPTIDSISDWGMRITKRIGA